MINETEILAVNSAKRTGPVATLCYSIIFILTEVMTQIVPYSFIYFNSEKKFPISSATMIAAIELAKFIICFLAFCGHQRRVRFVPSPFFFAPALFFVATVNLFFYCLNFVTPPTWNIIVQSRVIFMMFAGYVIYGRPIERRQWLAVGSLLFAILLAGWFCPEVDAAVDIQNNSIKQRDSIVWWTAASICGAVCSAISMSSSEYISREDSRPITEKHTQLHFFGTVIGILWATLVTGGNLVDTNVKVFFPLDFYLCVLTIAIGTLGGLSSTAIMVTRLSSCTEGHSITTAWIPPATFLSSAVGCSLLFPAQKYSNIVIAVLVLLVGAASFLNVTVSPSPSEKQSNCTRLEV
ncbi:uncharacterized protein [Asterias amurensis]|uniref:uncharacterized protein n=1 Tax=Asterias amurensis TaxID=7602 RepID=UPI003AB30287